MIAMNQGQTEGGVGDTVLIRYEALVSRRGVPLV